VPTHLPGLATVTAPTGAALDERVDMKNCMPKESSKRHLETGLQDVYVEVIHKEINHHGEFNIEVRIANSCGGCGIERNEAFVEDSATVPIEHACKNPDGLWDLRVGTLNAPNTHGNRWMEDDGFHLSATLSFSIDCSCGEFSHGLSLNFDGIATEIEHERSTPRHQRMGTEVERMRKYF
jgi:hypothetical protein